MEAVLTTMTDAELEALSAEFYEQRQILNARLGAISRELGEREKQRRLARLAEGFSAEELAKMQTIKAEGIGTGEVFGVPGTE